MKKAVVLLVSLFFIMSISIFVLKGLSDTEEFILKEHFNTNNIQLLRASKNIQTEISKLLLEHSEKVDDFLKDEDTNSFIPINNNELNIEFKIQKYDKVNVNDIKEKDSKKLEDFFLEKELDYYLFKESYEEVVPKSDVEITTNEQLRKLLNTYIQKKGENEILEYKDELGFLKEGKMYELFINSSFLSAGAKAYYVLSNTDAKIEVKYFDISFK